MLDSYSGDFRRTLSACNLSTATSQRCLPKPGSALKVAVRESAGSRHSLTSGLRLKVATLMRNSWVAVKELSINQHDRDI